MEVPVSVGGALTAIDTFTELTTFAGLTVSNGGILVPDGMHRLAAVVVSSASNSAAVDESMCFARLTGAGLAVGPQFIIGNGHGGQDATSDAIQITPTRIPHGVTVYPGKRITVEACMSGLDVGQLDVIVTLIFDDKTGGPIQSLCGEASSATDDALFNITAVGGVTTFPYQATKGDVLRAVALSFNSDYDEVGAAVGCARLSGAFEGGVTLDFAGPAGGGQLTTSMQAGSAPLYKPDINQPLTANQLTVQGASMGADVGATMTGVMLIIQRAGQ